MTGSNDLGCPAVTERSREPWPAAIMTSCIASAFAVIVEAEVAHRSGYSERHGSHDDETWVIFGSPSPAPEN